MLGYTIQVGNLSPRPIFQAFLLTLRSEGFTRRTEGTVPP
jgi:hypothetical protein